MKSKIFVLLVAVVFLLPAMANAQSFPRMGGARANDIYGFNGGGSVYGFRTQSRNLTGVQNQRQMLIVQRFRENALTGISRLTQAYSSGLGRITFSRGGTSRRYF
jgi:hypothetical protein